MKKSITLLTIALMFVSATNAQIWGNKKIKGNGNITTEIRNTGNYDGIKCAGSMYFILVPSNEGEITLEGDSNLLEYIITEVKNDNLVIKVKKGINFSYKSNAIKITVPFQDISKVSLAGSGDVINEGTITSNTLSVSLAGSGDMILNVEAKNIKTSLAGSGDITLKGITDDAKVSLAGSGDINAFGLQADNINASLAGSGDIQVTCNKNLKASVAGSGDIEYKGDPEVTKRVAGSGSVSRN